ncbi:unnamed protein product [Didymodactylos carnosus]|uniref:SGNH hydrolase-type esterase domain-containing protein n=2 Tax=Didymodactylos carnosus TaxID=1234261 RepID=A0A815AZS7_9BILA|nr:unnamed protein product [Didymodactylos carnosus]CAF4043156.1 unnamed protein product [Didymodactylos carnosus]
MGNLFASPSKLTSRQQERMPSTTENAMAVSKYVAIGASDAVGVGTPKPQQDGWVPKFASFIQAQKTVNLGVSGSTLNEALRQQIPSALQNQPDVITIWLAVNDFNQQVFDTDILNKYKKDLNIMLSTLRSKLGQEVKILVGNIPDLSKVTVYTQFGIPSLLLSIKVKQWNSIIAGAVKANRCTLVDLYKHWEELAKHPEYISFDGFHPSSDGYMRLAQVFYDQYKK